MSQAVSSRVPVRQLDDVVTFGAKQRSRWQAIRPALPTASPARNRISLFSHLLPRQRNPTPQTAAPERRCGSRWNRQRQPPAYPSSHDWTSTAPSRAEDKGTVDCLIIAVRASVHGAHDLRYMRLHGWPVVLGNLNDTHLAASEVLLIPQRSVALYKHIEAAESAASSSSPLLNSSRNPCG